MTDHALPHSARAAGRVFAVLMAVIALLAAFGALWIGVRGILTYGHLRAAQSIAQSAASELRDPATAPALIAELADETTAARALTSDPVWRIVELLPWVGPQLVAVSTVAAAADDVAAEALPPLATAASSFSLESLSPVDGRVDVSGFAAIEGTAATGADETAKAAASVQGIDRVALIAPLHSAVDDFATLLDTATGATQALANAAVLLPAMLGAEGPRNYLLLFQNNAEWRSLGGISGSVALIHTDGGAMALVDQRTAGSLGMFEQSVLPLDEETLAIYGERPGKWMHNVTQVPEFSTGAPLAREMWRRTTGLEVDGVVAVDPVALSYVLEATGPVTLPTGDLLTSENAVQLLVNEVYLRYPLPADQDVFFAQATASVFDALLKGTADPAALIDALSRAGAERRLLIWSAHESDHAVLAGTTLAGELPMTDADTGRFGVYLNDGTGSKMDYYLAADAQATWDQCTLNPDGLAEGTATLSVTVTSNAPADAAALPWYITGGEIFGVPAGIARTVGYVYLPEGFELLDAQITGDVGFGGGTHDGRRVLSFSVDLAPGESATATITAQTPQPGAPTLEVIHTPTIQPWTSVAAVCGDS